MNSPRLVSRLALAACALLVALLAAEAVVRALSLAPGFGSAEFGQHAASTDPVLLWENSPTHPGHNAFGLRGPPVAEEKTLPRVLLVGDSVAYGFLLDQDETISARLAAHLAALGCPAEILNGAVMGYNAAQWERRLERLAETLHPDHLLVLYCLNDPTPSRGGVPEFQFREARRHGQEDALARVMAEHRFSPLERRLMSVSHLARLIRHAGGHERVRVEPDDPQAHVTWLQGSDLDLVVAPALERLGAYARARGIAASLAVSPWFAGLTAEFYEYREHHERVRRLCLQHGVAYLDLLPPLFARTAETRRYYGRNGDPVHPSAEGADEVARALAPLLAPRLRRP